MDFVKNSVILQAEIFGNMVFSWLGAITIFALVLLGLKIFQTVLVAKLKNLTDKTQTEIDDVVIAALKSIHWPFYVLVAIYFALGFLNIPPLMQQWAYYIFLVAVIYYAIRFAEQFIDYGTKIFVARKEESKEGVGIIKLLSAVLKLVLWASAIVLILANMGYNVTSLIAGLGIGGIAVALALQNILGDLFSSLAIYFDKPFRIGDFVVIGDQMGTVKKIGIKTTRIQVPQGEELVVSNSELTKAQVRNFGVMKKRRGLVNIGVTYDTPAEKLKQIPGMIREIINAQANAEADRIHFKSFGDSSLVFEIVYYVHSGEYAKFMDAQQAVNLAIIEKFEQEEIEMAFPTQTIYVKK